MTRDINLFDMCDLSKTAPLGYYTSPQGRAANDYECPVSYVSQLPNRYNNLCWAATISTIIEYVTGEEKDVIDIAKRQHGNDFDHPVGVSNIGKVLLMDYDLEYSYVNKLLTDVIVLRNIKTDYPVYASFRYDENPNVAHAGTIYGVNVISGFMMVMDPSFGAATMTTKDGTTYSYICERNGKVLNLYRGVCYSYNW
jgi:hypothetical protein